ncbi:hypothetical protein UFOVP240_79 [uncultured Caudovirales phage]|uniref:Uncharacterized protein n=1 Tax=uncultured Caudovirales phage TaxID=2100421 RepID=A0A6J7WT03_9CAUD|nr:hypothetical protein UFOVP240_79 [uncultured Caudovirales phage]
MPNWCSNSTKFFHELKEKVDALEAELQKGDDAKLFNHFVPSDLKEEDDWYAWNVNNWGTKWEATVYDWERVDEHTIFISFDTAWSPPIALYETIADEEWIVTAQYHEPGMAFIGKFEDGIDEFYEYDLSDLDSIEMLPEDVIEYGNLREEYEMWKENSEEDE